MGRPDGTRALVVVLPNVGLVSGEVPWPVGVGVDMVAARVRAQRIHGGLALDQHTGNFRFVGSGSGRG